MPTKHGGRDSTSELLMGTPISLRVPCNLSHSCAVSGSDSRLSGFLELIHEQVLEHGLDPFCNFINLDETQIVLYPTQKQVAVICGIKRYSKLTWIHGYQVVHITMVSAIMSDRTPLPPTFICQG